MGQNPSSNHFRRYKLRDAAKDGRLVVYRCINCRRTSYFLASDLVSVFGGDFDAHTPPFECSKCGRMEISVGFRIPTAGDVGHLVIRRPGPVRQIQTWYNAKFGD